MRSIHLVSAAAILGLAGLPAGAGSDSDKAEEYVPKAEVETLHQAELPGMEGKEVVVKEFTLPPGFVGERHQHAGPVFVYVVEGELGIETDEGEQTFAAGSLYPEPLNTAMVGKNARADEPTRIVVFQVQDAGKAMMTKTE